jgi:asparagine synthetase B (glutamine-hydrolysing)
MASLLIWWSPDGAPIDDVIWDRMVAQVYADIGVPLPQKDNTFRGIGFRALAVRTLPSEPDSLERIAPDTLLLASLRHPLTANERAGFRFTEPAAVIRLEPAQKRLTLIRDLLGHRHLVWTRIPGGILAATREESLLAHPDVGRTLNDAHIASMLAYESPEDTSTPFAEIFAVAPGMTVEFTPRRHRLLREPMTPCDDVAGLSDAQMAARFGDLLEDSVLRASRGARRIGLSISSGLDAASIAAILMRHHTSAIPPIAVTYSYAVADGADCDERGPAAQLCRQLGIEFDSFDASTIPLAFTLDSGWTGPIGCVLENPYRELKIEVYRRLAAAGVDVLLAGHGADQFAMTPANWIWSAWKDRRFDWIASGLRSYLRDRGIWGTLRHPSLRRFAKYLLMGPNSLRRLRPPDALPRQFHEYWLDTRRAALARLADWPDPVRADAHFNLLESTDYAMEFSYTDRFGIDVRCPFRDWNLVQFVLSAPAYLMAGPIGYKWLQKAAVASDLGAEWINRDKCGDLSPLWKRHFALRQHDVAARRHGAQPEISRFSSGRYDNPSPADGCFTSTRATQLTSWLARVKEI